MNNQNKNKINLLNRIILGKKINKSTFDSIEKNETSNIKKKKTSSNYSNEDFIKKGTQVNCEFFLKKEGKNQVIEEYNYNNRINDNPFLINDNKIQNDNKNDTPCFLPSKQDNKKQINFEYSCDNNNKQISFEDSCDDNKEQINFEDSPHDNNEQIKIEKDYNYFSGSSKYLKYTPSEKIEEINCKKGNALKELTSENNYYIKNIPSILSIPRIRPIKEDHYNISIDRLTEGKFTVYNSSEDENLKKKENNSYVGSFELIDKKNKIAVNVPCYKINEEFKEFINKNALNVRQLEKDNDLDTDEEQLLAETERGFDSLKKFTNDVQNDKKYLENYLYRQNI